MNILDKHQKKILESKLNTKIIAGAGTGKTFSLLAKINYLVNNEKINPHKILVVSFTNASVDDIKRKLKFKVDVLTFHKLSIKILDTKKLQLNLINSNYLEFIIEEYLHTLNYKQKKCILKYLKYDKNYSFFLKSKEYLSFKKFIYKYICLIKSNDITSLNICEIKFNRLEKNILFIILNIYKIYIEEKNGTNSIDLDDLITYATSYVPYSNLKYDYIIIDEFQDTSLIRFNLIKALYEYSQSKLIVVGDDWQSIYRFTGCNLNLFLELDKFIHPLTTIKLEKNYRNSNEILKISKIFIEKNKKQIKKDLYSDNFIENPIKFIPYKNKYFELLKILINIINCNQDVIIISRNNKDIFEYTGKEIKFENEYVIVRNHKFKYLTIHKSKGLECENIILLNCNDNIMGIPNKIEDNSIIKKTFEDNEIKYSEERRLMYVALTRAKNYIYILYNKKHPSIFVKEIKKIIKKLS